MDFLNQLKNPWFFQENRMDPHSDHVVYAPEDSQEQIADLTKPFCNVDRGSSFRKSLNGDWQFFYAKNPAGALEGFEQPDYDRTGWAQIRVPGHIQLQGYGVPQYVNIQYPWDGREALESGEVPEVFNPVSHYCTNFSLPENFSGKRVFISFQGVESCFRLWLNGQYVGFSSDTFTPSEFELTAYLQEGENLLAVQVFQWYSGSWLEDQDFFRFSGIFRDVYLYAVPEHHVWDVKITAGSDAAGGKAAGIHADYLCTPGSVLKASLQAPDGTVIEEKDITVPDRKIATESQDSEPGRKNGIKQPSAKPGGGLLTKLRGIMRDGKTIPDQQAASKDNAQRKQSAAVPNETITAKQFSSTPEVHGNEKEHPSSMENWSQICIPVDMSFEISDPMLWSAEIPNLYLLTVEVYSPSGQKAEWFCQRIGIRDFRMDGNIMKLNGKRLVLRGVNRHEFSADSGRTVRMEETRDDLLTMKRHNINAIRLCHYPNSSPIYELADLLGFYLVDECNMETHGTWDMTERGLKPPKYTLPGGNVKYRDMLLDRIRSMYQRDKNHPSILLWSLGNESHGGPIIYAMSKELKKLDATRLVHYEGICHDRTYPDTSDVESQMYLPVSKIREFLAEHRDKPFISCEYMHAMGNSCGALFKYTDLTQEDELYQGGFIWDYIDQAIRTTDRYGQELLAYGGDQGDRPHDGNFSGDGLVTANRQPTPKLTEVKYCYQDLQVDFAPDFPEQKAVFTIKNQKLFADTSGYICRILLERNGHAVEEAQLDLVVPAQTQQEVALPFTLPEDPGEYCLTVSFCLKENTPWAAAGYEVAFGQKVYQAGEIDPKTFLQKKLQDVDTAAGILNIPCNNDAAEPKGCARETTHYDGEKDGAADGKDATVSDGISLRIINGSYNIGVRGQDFDILFSKLYGGLVSYRYQGQELLAGMVKPNFWRAPVDNDNGNMMPFRCAIWKTASMYSDHKNLLDLSAYFRLENPQVQERDGKVELVYTYYFPANPIHSCRLIYLVDSEGVVETNLEYEPPAQGELPEFPEFSVMLKLDAAYDTMEWYGLGPEDCYPDRKSGAKLGIFQSAVQDTVTEYLVPQETGAHADVRWMTLTKEDGLGMAFGCNGLSVNASPYSPHELENALHPGELPPVHYTYVRIGRQMGLGGDDSWGALPHDEYRLFATQPRKITFWFRGIRN